MIDEVHYPAESNDAILWKRWMEMNERLPILKTGKGGWRHIQSCRLHHEKVGECYSCRREQPGKLVRSNNLTMASLLHSVIDDKEMMGSKER